MPWTTFLCVSVLFALCIVTGSSGPATIYTSSELRACGGWVSKGPNFAYDRKGNVFVVNACRGKSMLNVGTQLEDEIDVAIALSLNRTASNNSVNDISWRQGRRLDPVNGQVIVFKRSSDGGKSWSGFQVVSGAHSGYSSAKAIYDVKRKQLVVQFMRYPSKKSSDTTGARLFQRVSSDGGKTWSGKRDLTNYLAPCNHGGNPPSGMAGSRVQTPSGRLIFGGFGYHGARCIWYSDDGGNTYTCTGLQQERTNEWSIAVAGNTGKLIINSRAGGGSFAPYRPSYFSSDDGVSWSGALNSKWRDSINKNNHGCEASLLGVGSRVYYFNPTGQGKNARTKMMVRCSLDGGRTLTSEGYGVLSTSAGGYSDMAPSTKGKLLIGWGDTSNVFVELVDTDWCH